MALMIPHVRTQRQTNRNESPTHMDGSWKHKPIYGTGGLVAKHLINHLTADKFRGFCIQGGPEKVSPPPISYTLVM